MAKDQTHLRVIGGSFTTEDTNTYDVNRRYVFAGKEKVTITVAIPIHIFQKMKTLMMKGTIPEYTSPGAVVRDALFHRFYHIDRSSGDMLATEALVEFLQEIELEKIAVRTANLIDKFDTYERTASQLHEVQDWPMLGKHLRILRNRLESCQFETPWDDKLDDMITKWEVRVPDNWKDQL